MRRLTEALAVVVILAALALVMGCGSTGSGTSSGRSLNAAGTQSKIAYSRMVQQGRNLYPRVFTIDPDGTGVTEVAGNGSVQPAWSPDGTKIVYCCSNRLYTMNADGSAKSAITSKYAPGDPAWSPDGSKIAFQGSGIYTVPATGGTARLVPGSVPGDQFPCWSPNGDFILFEGSQRKDANGNEAIGLYTIPSSGGTATLLVDTYDAEHPYGYAYHSDSDWSGTTPNRVIYRVYARDGSYGSTFYVYCVAVQVSGSSVSTIGTPFEVRRGDHPSWSPNGLQAAVSATETAVFVQDVPMGPATPRPWYSLRISPPPVAPGMGMDPDWSP